MAVLMPHTKAPCQDCPDRTVGCHGTCEKFAEYKSKRDKLRFELQKKKQEAEIVDGYIARRACKCKDEKLPMR